MKPAIFAVVTAIACALVGSLGHLLNPWLLLALYGTCFFPYAVTLGFQRKQSIDLRVIIAAAVCVRVILLFCEPILSGDIYRYIWEGRVILDGGNPYVHAPNSEYFVALRDATIWPQINHPQVPAIYPPFAQYVFVIPALWGGETISMKLLLLIFEAIACVVVFRLLRESLTPGRLAFAASTYLLNPLIIFEVAWSGHLDVLAWSTLSIGLLLARQATRSERVGFVLAFAFSIGSKFIGAMIFPYLVARNRFRQALPTMASILAVLVVLGAAYVPFTGDGLKLFSGFGTYAAAWKNNDGLYRVSYKAARSVLDSRVEHPDKLITFSALDKTAMDVGFTKEWEGKTIPNTTFATRQIAETFAKAIAALMLGIALLVAWRKTDDPVFAMLIALTTLYLFAPTVHPWYVAWLIPLCAIRFEPTALVFSAASVIGYVSWANVETGKTWHIGDEWVAVEYGIVLAVGVWAYVIRRQRWDFLETVGEPELTQP